MNKDKILQVMDRISVGWFMGGAAVAAVMFAMIILRMNSAFF